MERFMQHYMIRMKKGEVHPLFRLEYLPENLASLVETIVLLAEGLLGLMFISGLAINIFASHLSDSAFGYIINAGLTQILAAVKVTNNITSGYVSVILIIVIYYFSRKYFEHVKYNLHILRTCGDSKNATKEDLNNNLS